ncbi:MAG: hypothetical protein O6940_07285 [Ignavibacteria bacterium]|nr:hypothetical protein [Ignavibacteria bacterium]
MTGFIKVVIFFILFLLIIRVIRFISRYWLSSKKTIDDLKQHQKKKPDRFENVEDAKFREIDPNKKEKSK